MNPGGSAVVAILAGGRSRRMGRSDKARIVIGSRRMIDIVADRLATQASTLLVSGPRDFETGLPVVLDIAGAPPGPAGGVWSVRRRLGETLPEVAGFVTAPVDGPFVPLDLVERVTGQDRSAICADLLGEHPSFGYWRTSDLDEAFAQVTPGSDLSLRRLALLCNARLEVFDDTRSLFNVNSPEDVALATSLVEGGSQGA